jgi:hypothetical protein
MEAAHADLPLRDFERPSGIVEYEICAPSGARPTEYCPERKEELFAREEPPLDESHDWYQMAEIDAFTGLRANELCVDHVVEAVMLDITDERGREWVRAHPEQFGGQPLAPLEACTDATERPEMFIAQPLGGAVVHGMVDVVGTVLLPNFDHYEAQYGVGSDPQGWGWISGPHLAQVRDDLLTRWDTTHLAPGPYTLRIRAFDRQQHTVEARVQIQVAAPTPLPTPLPSPTPHMTPTPRPTATATGMPTPTSPPPVTPTEGSAPTSSPAPEVTPAEGQTATPAP